MTNLKFHNLAELPSQLEVGHLYFLTDGTIHIGKSDGTALSFYNTLNEKVNQTDLDNTLADYYSNVSDNIMGLFGMLEAHEKGLINSEEGLHGVRIWDGKLEQFSNGTWLKVVDELDFTTLQLSANQILENSDKIFMTPSEKAQINDNTSTLGNLSQRVVDLENNEMSASDIKYNNTSTNLVSNSVQDVVSELNVKVDGLDSDFSSYDTTLTSLDARLEMVELNNADNVTAIDELEAKDISIDSEIASIKTEQYKIKSSNSDMSPSYLDGKVDNVTVEVVSDKLVVKNLSGLTIGVSDLNTWLSGTSSNIQTQINTIQSNVTSMATGMTFNGKVNSYSELVNIPEPLNGTLVVVLSDESLTGGRSLYVYSDTLNDWDFIGEFIFSDAFLELTDTPTSYLGANNMIVKVDETNGQLLFANVDWSELQNKPFSSIADIDGAVTKTHEHSNKVVLDKFTEATDGKLLYNGSLIEGGGTGGASRDFTKNPLNIISETTALLPKNRYVPPTAEDITISDVSNNFTANNIEGVLAELFQFADSGKTQIANAVGSPLTNKDTFIQMKDKIMQLKTLLAEAISEKGVMSYPHNTLNEMVDKIKIISRVTLDGGLIKLSNIKITAPSKYSIVLKERLDISDIVLSVRELVGGNANATHFELGFNGSDALLFEPNENVTFNGALSLTPSVTETIEMSKLESWLDNGFVSTLVIVNDDTPINNLAVMLDDNELGNNLILHNGEYKYFNKATGEWIIINDNLSSQHFTDSGMKLSEIFERKTDDINLGDMELVESANGDFHYSKVIILNKYKDISKISVDDIYSGKILLESQDKAYSTTTSTVDYITKMTSNFLPSPFTTSSSSIFSASYAPWKAFNGTNLDVNDCWATVSGTTTGWIELDMGAKRKVNKLQLTVRNNAAGEALQSFPKDFKVLGSNDGVDYVEIASFTTTYPTTHNKTYTFLLPESNYRRYRVQVLSNHGMSTYTTIAEILYSYESISYVELPVANLYNLNKYGVDSVIEGLSNSALSRSYILQDLYSRGSDNLIRVPITKRISSLIYRREI